MERFAVDAGDRDVRRCGAGRGGDRIALAADRLRGAAGGGVVLDRLATAGSEDHGAGPAGHDALLRERAGADGRRADLRRRRRGGRARAVVCGGHGRRGARGRNRNAQARHRLGATLGPLSVAGHGGGPRARRPDDRYGERRRRRHLRVPGGAAAAHRDTANRTARPPRYPPHPLPRAGCRVRRHSRLPARRPTPHGQLVGQRPPRQPARHRAADRPRRRRGGDRRHECATRRARDGGHRAGAARCGPGGAERAAQR